MAQKILLADNSLTIQKVIELILGPEGFEIHSCNNGKEAIEILGMVVPDLVLADHEMPEIDGYQLCTQIKKDPALSHIPVILLAGAFEPFDDARAREAEADGMIVKPFESAELLSKVNAAIEKSKKLLEERGQMPGPSAEPAPDDEFSLEGITIEAVPPESAPGTTADDGLADFLKEGFAELGIEEAPEESPSVSGTQETGIPVLQSFDRDDDLIDILPAGEQQPQQFRIFDGEQISVETVPVESTQAGISEHRMSAVAAPLRGEPVPVSREDLVEALRTVLRESAEGSLREEVLHALRETVSETIRPEMEAVLLSGFSPIFREAIRMAVSDCLPGIIENITRELLTGISGPLMEQIRDVMEKTVPDIAETMIGREIDKIIRETV